MKKEIELKFRVKDFGSIRSKLKSLRAKIIWKGREENWYFNTTANALSKKYSVLRIKKMGDIKLTLKENRHIERGVKVATEYQVTIDDPRVMKTILEKLGFKEVLHYYKNREHWGVEKCFC